DDIGAESAATEPDVEDVAALEQQLDDIVIPEPQAADAGEPALTLEGDVEGAAALEQQPDDIVIPEPQAADAGEPALTLEGDGEDAAALEQQLDDIVIPEPQADEESTGQETMDEFIAPEIPQEEFSADATILDVGAPASAADESDRIQKAMQEASPGTPGPDEEVDSLLEDTISTRDVLDKALAEVEDENTAEEEDETLDDVIAAAPPKQKRSASKALMVLLVLCVVAAGGFYAYTSFLAPSEQVPARVKKSVAKQDKVLDKVLKKKAPKAARKTKKMKAARKKPATQKIVTATQKPGAQKKKAAAVPVKIDKPMKVQPVTQKTAAVQKPAAEKKPIAKKALPTKKAPPAKKITTARKEPAVQTAPPKKKTLPPLQQYFSIHAGSYKRKSNADRIIARLVKSGFDAYCEKAELGAKGVWFRVKIGKFATRLEAEKKQQELNKKITIQSRIVMKK
ncbi:SPOR domain-containing protein, partial [Thermodesulfobacteriota bacterium]